MARIIVFEDLVGPVVAGRGGHAMYVLQWLHGFRRLGHEVLFVEFVEDDPHGDVRRRFASIIEEWWEPRCAALLTTDGEALWGVSASQVRRFAATADALVELATHYRREPWPLVGDVHPHVLVDTDPGYTQLWADEGKPAEVFGGPDVAFTVGLNVGSSRSALPSAGLSWHPIVNPVILDWWEATGRPAPDRFTTVGAWRDYGYLEFDGRVLGPKVEEFRRFLELPELLGEPVELVLQIDCGDPDRRLLLDHGWRLESPDAVSTPARYRDYVSGSAGEFSCAKGVYVGTRSGWFSDRSACYLAAGRPVVVQATGFEDVLPTGEGLFAVNDVAEAAEAISAVRRDYARHSAAARAVAREFFDSERVVAELLRQAGVDARGRA